ncbi:hypothetical protein BC830DRAFT_1175271 [Chytriomyces sp. MP71]|nr:hypothetical protein BC830DRAFT_1175271 [Chytriomyces sp. MP71]
MSCQTKLLCLRDGFVVRSDLDPFDGSIQLTVLSSLHATVWTGRASHRSIEAASETAGYSDRLDAFAQLVRDALAGNFDAEGRPTECSVNVQAQRLYLKVIAAQDIEFEVLSIPLSPHTQSYADVSYAVMNYLIEDRGKMQAKISDLTATKTIMQRDLTLLKQSFNEWSSEKLEQYELDLFTKFKNVLNAKKRKIRELMANLETAEAKVASWVDKKPIVSGEAGATTS